MLVMTDVYGSLHSLAIFSASLLLTLMHSGDILAFVVKTKELNVETSQCQSFCHCTYPFFVLFVDLRKRLISK